jgi:hypothetical protein
MEKVIATSWLKFLAVFPVAVFFAPIAARAESFVCK